MLAKAVSQSRMYKLTRRFREQARSHSLVGVQQLFIGSTSRPWRVGKHIGAHLVRIHACFHQCIQSAVDHRR